MNFKDFNLNVKDKKYLILLLIITLISTIKISYYNYIGCISNPDVALYLISGLKYAGIDQFNIANSSDLFYTPVISFLSSLFFKIGYVDKNAIIIVTTIFCFLGYFGLYILLRNRFNSLLSFTGVIIYGSLPIIVVNSCRGMIDVPAISIFIWVLVFGIIAIDKNPKYFLIASPLFIIGFFTKYIVGFTLPLILLYYLMNKNIIGSLDCIIHDNISLKETLKNYLKSLEFKYIFISIVIGAVLGFIICKTLILDFGCSLTFIKSTINTLDGNKLSGGIDFNLDKSYYFDHFTDIIFQTRNFRSIFSTILYAIFGIGFIATFLKFIVKSGHFESTKQVLKTKFFEKALILISIIFIVIAIVSFIVLANHMACNISMLIVLTILFSLLQRYDIDEKCVKLDFLFIAYFLVTFIFISLVTTKVPRYSLIVIPAFIYFIIWGLDSIVSNFNNRKILEFKINELLPVLIILIFLFLNMMVILNPLEHDDSGDVFADVYDWDYQLDLIEACNFIKSNDSNYHNKNFTSFFHHSRILRWYLNDNFTIVDESDSLKKYDDTDYVILTENRTMLNYNQIFSNDQFYVYYLKS